MSKPEPVTPAWACMSVTLHDYRAKRAFLLAWRVSVLAVLVLCILLSKGSTWWTLVTSLMFLAVFGLMMASIKSGTERSFASLDDLQAWVDQQRAIEAIVRPDTDRR